MFKLAPKEYQFVMTEREQLRPKTELRSQLEKQWPFTPTKGTSGQSHQFFAHAISATQAYPPIYLFEYRICSLYSQTSEIL